jgi:endogenous inhibitor of DNA gyrase (YacG/DUF329 family)
MAPTTVQCPTCGKLVAWVDTQKFKPFCSERCKLIDLGEWASGTYAIPGEDLDDIEPDPRDFPDE